MHNIYNTFFHLRFPTFPNVPLRKQLILFHPDCISSTNCRELRKSWIQSLTKQLFMFLYHRKCVCNESTLEKLETSGCDITLSE